MPQHSRKSGIERISKLLDPPIIYERIEHRAHGGSDMVNKRDHIREEPLLTDDLGDGVTREKKSPRVENPKDERTVEYDVGGHEGG